MTREVGQASHQSCGQKYTQLRSVTVCTYGQKRYKSDIIKEVQKKNPLNRFQCVLQCV